MVRSLDLVADPYNLVVEFTIGSLCPGGDRRKDDPTHVEKRQDRARLMNREQVRSIRDFLVCVAENSAESELIWLSISRGLEEVWK
jgi:hypothetical protein